MKHSPKINIFKEKNDQMGLSKTSDCEKVFVDANINLIKKTKIKDITYDLKEEFFKNPNYAEPTIIWDSLIDEEILEFQKTKPEANFIENNSNSLNSACKEEINNTELEKKKLDLIDQQLKDLIQNAASVKKDSKTSFSKENKRKSSSVSNKKIYFYLLVIFFLSNFFSLLNQAQINTIVKSQKSEMLFLSNLASDYFKTKINNLTVKAKESHQSSLPKQEKHKDGRESQQPVTSSINLKTKENKSNSLLNKNSKTQSRNENNLSLSKINASSTKILGYLSPSSQSFGTLQEQVINKFIPSKPVAKNDEKDFSEIRPDLNSENAYPIVSSKNLQSYTNFASEIIQPKKSIAQSSDKTSKQKLSKGNYSYNELFSSPGEGIKPESSDDLNF